jgi:hypothetical protein
MPGNMGVIVHFARTYMPADAVSIIMQCLCMATQLIIEGIPAEVSRRDEIFMHRILDYHRLKFQDQIREMRLRQPILHPTADFLSLCVTSFDYTKVPVDITVGPLSDFLPKNIRDHPCYPILKQLGKYNGRVSLTCILAPSTVHWAIRPEESVITDPRSFDLSGLSDMSAVREMLDEFTRN